MDNNFDSSTLPSSEKEGLLLFWLGTFFSLLIITGVVVLGVIYFISPQ